MRATFQNTGMVLSIGVFFSLMIVGMSSSLPDRMESQLRDNAVPAATAEHIAELPAVSTLFAAFLGYNPMEKLLDTPAAGAGGTRRLPPAGRSACSPKSKPRRCAVVEMSPTEVEQLLSECRSYSATD